MSGDPKRLIDDAAASPALRDDLAHVAAAPPVKYDAGAGLAKLQATLSAGTPVATTAAGGAIKMKLLGLALITAVGAMSAVAVLGSGATPSPLPSPAPTLVPQRQPQIQRWPDQQSNPQPQPELRALPQSLPESQPSPSPRPHLRPRRPEPSARVTKPSMPAIPALDAPDPDERLRRETAQLADARRLLTTDPAAALNLAEAGQREFARGMFNEERAAIAIFALAKLGRTTEASDRAEMFLRRYPAGSFSHRVRKLVAAPGDAASPSP